MRNLLLLGGLIVAASMAGWFSVDRNDGETTIKINRTEIRNDAKQAIDKGRDYLNRRDNPNYRGEQGYGYVNESGRDSYPGQSPPNQDLRYDYGQYGGQPAGTSAEQPLRYQEYGPQQPASGAPSRYPVQSAGNPQQYQYSR